MLKVTPETDLKTGTTNLKFDSELKFTVFEHAVSPFVVLRGLFLISLTTVLFTFFLQNVINITDNPFKPNVARRSVQTVPSTSDRRQDEQA